MRGVREGVVLDRGKGVEGVRLGDLVLGFLDMDVYLEGPFITLPFSLCGRSRV